MTRKLFPVRTRITLNYTKTRTSHLLSETLRIRDSLLTMIILIRNSKLLEDHGPFTSPSLYPAFIHESKLRLDLGNLYENFFSLLLWLLFQ